MKKNEQREANKKSAKRFSSLVIKSKQIAQSLRLRQHDNESLFIQQNMIIEKHPHIFTHDVTPFEKKSKWRTCDVHTFEEPIVACCCWSCYQHGYEIYHLLQSPIFPGRFEGILVSLFIHAYPYLFKTAVFWVLIWLFFYVNFD